MEMLISWSSDRLIESEEKKKEETRKKLLIDEHDEKDGETGNQSETTFCREMLFFLNFDNLASSEIPSLYSSPPPSKCKERVCVLPPLIPFALFMYFSVSSR